MPIVIQPKGLGQLYGNLTKLIGQAQAEERAIERASREQERLLDIQSRKDFALMQRRWEIEDAERAHQWQLEKMELASRADFMREEQQRQRKLDERQARLDALEQALKEDTIDINDYKKAVLQETTEIPFYTQGQIAERAAARPTTARVPTESQYAYLSSQGYSDEDIREMFGLTAPNMTPVEIPVTTSTTPDWKSKIGQEVAVVDGVSYTYNETGEFVPMPTTDIFGGGLGGKFRGYGAGGTWEEPTAPVTKAPTTTPIYQKNPTTGQVRVSYDGGKTWQILG